MSAAELLLRHTPRWLVWRWSATRLHAIAALALLAWTAFECFGPTPTQGIAASTYDQMQQRRLWASAPDPRLLIVDIDERSLADMAGEFGRWPWPRDTLATVLEHSQRQGAAAVVFDVLFSDPDRLRPGGDHALEAAVRASTRSFFPVLRLPAALDAQSELRADAVPGLARPGTGAPPRVAAVIPFMHTMLNSQRLGTHTAHLDGDGKIRRFALHEDLPGGWQLRSIPAAVAQHLGVSPQPDATPRLVVWRQQAQAYPRVPFSVVWACAEGQQRADCPVLAGRILLVGATASSLHDIKTTPLASQHMGVDILATLIDNALHQRHYTELPPAARWALCVAALALAWGVVRRGRAGASTRALWLLPSALMAIGWASLHSERYFLDLTLPAGSALTFLSFVALFDKWRRHHLGGTPCAGTAIVCASASMHAEPLERAVLDAAALHGARVTGATSTSGEHGQTHTVWVLWRLPDAAVARALSVQLPAAWCRVFDAGTDPLRAQLLAMAQALPAPASANTPPRESHLAST